MAENAQEYEFATERYSDAKAAVKYWAAEIDAATEREKKWRENAKRACSIYDAGSDGESNTAFNILHSNTETMVPALYNSTPVPDIRPRNNRKDDIARKAGDLMEESINYQIDAQDFDDIILAAVYNGEVAGRGITRVRYEPTTEPIKDQETGEQIVFEDVTLEHVPWERYRRGPALSWAGLPWEAFELSLSRDELRELIMKDEKDEAGKTVADAVPLVEGDEAKDDEKAEGVFKRAKVWEIWDKDTRSVIYFAPGYEAGLLTVIDDPLGMMEFWPNPKPIQFVKRQGKDKLTPICPYNVYKKQAEELNVVSERILKLTSALKYRGVRASEISELENVATADDGEFVPSKEAMAVIQANGGLDKAIWVMPIDMLVAVIKELIIQRESIKQAIYEITGISDVLRGATDPNETYGAQNLKAQYGSLRLQKRQGEVQRYVRDLFSLMGEIIANKFQPETIQLMAGSQVSPQEIALLQSDVQRHYRIDVETDSTIAGDVGRLQQNMNGFIQGTAQFLQAVLPGVQSGILPAPAAAEIFSAFAGTFRLGRRVEDVLAQVVEQAENMPDPTQPKPEQKAMMQAELREKNAGAVKDEAEAQKTQVETQLMGSVDARKTAAETQLTVVNAQRTAMEPIQTNDANG